MWYIIFVLLGLPSSSSSDASSTTKKLFSATFSVISFSNIEKSLHKISQRYIWLSVVLNWLVKYI